MIGRRLDLAVESVSFPIFLASCASLPGHSLRISLRRQAPLKRIDDAAAGKPFISLPFSYSSLRLPGPTNLHLTFATTPPSPLRHTRTHISQLIVWDLDLQDAVVSFKRTHELAMRLVDEVETARHHGFDFVDSAQENATLTLLTELQRLSSEVKHAEAQWIFDHAIFGEKLSAAKASLPSADRANSPEASGLSSRVHLPAAEAVELWEKDEPAFEESEESDPVEDAQRLFEGAAGELWTEAADAPEDPEPAVNAVDSQV